MMWIPLPVLANGPHNISITMTSYLDGNDGHADLYEYNIVPSSVPGEFELESDYYDYILIHVRYYDPWMGMVDIGGTEFLYDDMDPSDSWEHAGNWSFRFSTPVPSTGPEDTNGFQGGLDEVGWYYISFSMDWGAVIGAPDRTGFSVKYEFDVGTDDRDVTDDGANVIEDAGPFEGDLSRRVQSAYDQVDWYRFTGSDPEKLWKMSFTINRTLGLGQVDQNSQRIYDTHQFFFVMIPESGADEIWDTEDDTWSYLWWKFTFFITGPGAISGNQTFGFTLNNTWTDHPDRGVYVGTYVTPITAGFEGTEITGYYYTSWTTFSDYTIDFSVIEESVNRRPQVKDLDVTSDNEFERSGGDVSDTFSFEVTYQDPDGDEPSFLDLYLDPGTKDEKVYSMLGEDDGGSLKTGRTYYLILEGDDIEEKDGTYSLMVNASDRMEMGSLRTSLTTNNLYLNGTLSVWDDDEVEYVPSGSLDPMSEDQGLIMIPLEQFNGGPFRDPERSFVGFKVWNGSLGEWSDDSKQDIVRIEIVYRVGDGWYAEVSSLENKHGEELIGILAFDDHSYVDANLSLTVQPVNDPPVLDSVEFNGEDVSIDRSDPLELEVDLQPYGIKEEEEFEVHLFASDSDPEEDRTPISFSLVGVGKGSWSSSPQIDPSTGVLKYTPQNSDVRENGWMTFRITDGFDLIDVKLWMDVSNTPDDPVISTSHEGLTVMEGATWTMDLSAEDVDKGETFVYSINLDEEIGSDYTSISDQLPEAVLGVDLRYDFDEVTGYLSLTPMGENIWKTSNSLLEEVTVTFVVLVTDSDGRTDMKVVNLTMIKNGPWIPAVPDFTITVTDEDPDTPGDQGLKITVTAEEIDTKYDPAWVYSWVLSDGNKITGREFEHTFTPSGDGTTFTYNIKLKLVLDEYMTPEGSKTVTLMIPVVKEDKKEETSILPFIIGGAVLLLLIIIALVLFIGMRRRSEMPPADTEGVSPQGFSGPQSREVRARSPSPLYSQQPAREEHFDDSVRCPNCGSPVQKDWFLCPECKDPLKW